jgi:hypothetical protein
MLDGQEVMEIIRLLTVEGRPTEAVLAQTCMGVFLYSLSVWYNFCNAFSFETARRPPRTTL